MKIITNPTSETPLFKQIVNQLREMILLDELRDGFVMPSERKMAELLGVHRNTIIRVYGELKAEGLLESVERSGYKVKNPLHRLNHVKNERHIIWENEIKEEYVNRKIKRYYSDKFNPGCDVSFLESSVPSGYAEEHINEILNELSVEYTKGSFMGTPRKGSIGLRNALSFFLKEKGISAPISQIQIMDDTYQGIEYLVNLLISPGDVILMEEPVGPDVCRIFNASRAKVITVKSDDYGMQCDKLEGLIQKYNPKLIYVEPDFHNPTGTVMSLDRRRKILDLSYKYGVPILEEDVCSMLRFEGRDIPSIKSLDHGNNVIYMYSFVTTVPAGIKLAFMVADTALIDNISDIIFSRIVCVNRIGQDVMQRYIERGYYKDDCWKLCADFREKRDIMINIISDEVKDKDIISYIKPEGGVWIWCKLSDKINSNKLHRLAQRNGIDYYPGSLFYQNGSYGTNYFRLVYSYSPKDEIEHGMKVLAELLNWIA
ncbi:MAG: PLP-dependent aminotransferase family protein [Lachnospiraceae bacterium]